MTYVVFGLRWLMLMLFLAASLCVCVNSVWGVKYERKKNVKPKTELQVQGNSSTQITGATLEEALSPGFPDSVGQLNQRPSWYTQYVIEKGNHCILIAFLSCSDVWCTFRLSAWTSIFQLGVVYYMSSYLQRLFILKQFIGSCELANGFIPVKFEEVCSVVSLSAHP